MFLHQTKRGNKPCLASLIAERMRLLAAGLSDRGGEQYVSLRSSDRSTAGAPEVTQRAVEELLYEESLSHLHPTTATRAVTVCDTCAMVRLTGTLLRIPESNSYIWRHVCMYVSGGSPDRCEEGS